MAKGVLFVHNNFPGQFRDLVTALRARKIPVWSMGQTHAPGMPDVPIVRYKIPRGSTPDIYNPATRAEADLIRGFGAYKAFEHLKRDGCDPAVIVAHPGWGEMSYAHLIYPDAKQILFAEFYYNAIGYDVSFDPEFSETTEERLLVVEAKNLGMALAFSRADAIVSPTEFQRGSLPPNFRAQTRVIHEGVDVEAIGRLKPEPFTLPNGAVLQPGAPVITHINNQMEPLRGLHVFARALPRLLAEVPDAQVLIIGEEKKAGYGSAAPDGKTWKQFVFEPLQDKLDMSRVHFLGKVPHPRMLAALQLSTAHVYYTYPFVLSWSLAEAMASGCYVIASDTAPVRDAVTDGVDGKLLPFFDLDALSTAMIEACRDPQASAPLRAQARKTAARIFNRADGRLKWLKLLREFGIPTGA